MILHHDRVGRAIQAMPIVEGNLGLTSTDGAQTGNAIALCTADGGFTITFVTGTTADISFLTGDVRTFPRKSSITITSGTFDFA